jgi:PAS domain S-box-containing protein
MHVARELKYFVEMKLTEPRADELKFLLGGGELSELIRSFDWTSTPLGPIGLWPQSLKTSVSLMLNSQSPVWIGWGPEATCLYNDAYIHVLSAAKHPVALGKPVAEVWAEIWDVCGPLVDKVFSRGEASYMNDVRFFMRRGDFTEENFYSFSYTPIREESGNVGGLFCQSTDVTANALNTRRLRILSDLSAKSFVEKTTQSACASAAAILGRNPDDIPVVLLYLIDADGNTARLEQAAGVAGTDDRICPRSIELNSSTGSQLWPLKEVMEAGQLKVVPLRGLPGLPSGPAGQRVSEAVVLPVALHGHARPFGVLIAGVNPARRLDPEYRTFYTLVAGHIATAIQNARGVEEEKKRTDMLADLDRAKTTFFSNVSHELRTPLTLILGPLEDEIRESVLPRQRLELAHRNSLRLLKLVNTLLDFSRIEAGRMEPFFEPTDLSSFTAELVGVFRAGIEKAGLRLIVDCPPLKEQVCVDPDMWEKIVFNLMSNAFKFTAQGEIEVKLQEEEGADESNGSGRDGAQSPPTPRVCLSVRDTGIGIPAAELPRVFERFRRVENVWARSHEGTGIGLALVQELARLHGGDVEVKSVEGRGTTFTVSIPTWLPHLAREPVGAAPPSDSTDTGVGPFLQEVQSWTPERLWASGAPKTVNRTVQDLSPVDGNGRSVHIGADGISAKSRIILADDNSDMRGYVQRMLADHGYEVVAVADGRAALEAAQFRTPSLVLSDVMMPHLDGFGLLRELRKNPVTKGVPIILLSARAGEEARVEGVEAGANDYLTKPFNARELLARVASHLELARVRKEASDAFRAATAKFRALFDQSAVFAAILSPDGTVLEANSASLAGSGYRAEDVLGRLFWECGWWHDSRENHGKIQLAAREAALGVPYLEKLHYHRADGTQRVVELTLHPIRNDAGQVIFIHATGNDVTERQRVQARTEFLSRLAQKLSIVSDSAEINRIATQEIGQFLGAQRCFFVQAVAHPGRVRVLPDWYADGLKSLTGEYEVSLFGGPEWSQAIKRAPVIIDDVQVHPWTRDYASAYGSVQMRAYAFSPFIHEGEWVACIGVCSDKPRVWEDDEKALLESLVARVWPLMERARVEGELRESEDALREANVLLSDKAAHLESVVQQRTAKLRETIGELEAFSYSIAHDMRAPLRSLQGFSEILLTDYEAKLDGDGQRFLQRISTSAGRMDKLIQDVLNYSRVVRGDLPFEKIDVEQLLRGIVETYPMFAPEIAEIHLEGKFPQVLGNEAMLMQIFSNLMGNGIKFVPPGVKPRLKVWAESRTPRVRIFVEDNGIGIDPEQHERIFGIFQQLSRNHDGTGIGLAIVKKAVERMGGSLGLTSEPDKGSTFWFEMQAA